MKISEEKKKSELVSLMNQIERVINQSPTIAEMN